MKRAVEPGRMPDFTLVRLRSSRLRLSLPPARTPLALRLNVGKAR